MKRFRAAGWPQAMVVFFSMGFLVWGVAVARSYHNSAPALPAHALRQVPYEPPKSLPQTVVADAAAHTSCTQKPCLALTFDDGPNAVVTPQVLDILARHQVHATFFVIGLHVPGNESLLKRMYAEGHEIGNHSWGHVDMTTLSPQQMRQQVYDTQAVVSAAGVPAPRMFRPPYGAINQVVRSQVPLTIALWDIDPEDWHMKNPKQIIERVETTAKPGGMVDMHDIYQQTADALDPLLTNLQQRYQLVTVSELLQLAPGQPGVFYGR